MREVHIVLASASPRRRELLERLGWHFDVVPADVEELKIPGEVPSAMVMRLARLKGESVAASYPESLVISSDTTVALGSEIFGKPKDDDDALRMLRALSGHTHSVYTGLAIFWRGRSLCSCDCTQVTFRELSPQSLKSYTATGEPRGKAGAYAIQGLGGLMIQSIHGDYSTVVGLPLCLLGRMMEELGFSLSELWEVSGR